MKRKNGSTLITTFLFLSLAALLSALAYHYASQSLMIKSETIKSVEAKEKDIEGTFKKYIKQQPTSGSILECYKEKKELCLRTNRQYSEIAKENTVTGVLLDNPVKFPLFDMEKLFNPLSSCPKKVKHTGDSTINGTFISEHSSVAKQTCLFIKPGTYQDIRINENIFSDFEIALTGGFITTSGYVQSLGNLTIDKDFLIFAAGDINLNKLTVLNSAHLTLVSTTGLIYVNELIGTPKLKTISRLGTFINGDSLPQDLIQDIPYLDNLIISYSD